MGLAHNCIEIAREALKSEKVPRDAGYCFI